MGKNCCHVINQQIRHCKKSMGAGTRTNLHPFPSPTVHMEDQSKGISRKPS